MYKSSETATKFNIWDEMYGIIPSEEIMEAEETLSARISSDPIIIKANNAITLLINSA